MLILTCAGRFRDAEIASESIHSSVQLLSLYHDTLLLRAISLTKSPLPAAARAVLPTAHSRYTRHWTAKSTAYRRVAYCLQILRYTELLVEMAAKRRNGEKGRWRAVVIIEMLKAICRLVLLRITRKRPLVSPELPERVPVPEDEETSEAEELLALEEQEQNGHAHGNGTANGGPLQPHPNGNGHAKAPQHPGAADKEWNMPRTGMSLPNLPLPGDTTSYLLSRVLTAEDIKPATKLLLPLANGAYAAEVVHILAPLLYAVALSQAKQSSDPRWQRSWAPWLLGVGLELLARQLRQRNAEGRDFGGRTMTPLEREEWNRRGWALAWWAMRGKAYETVMKGVVEKVKGKMPRLVGGILEDYEYLWENYYFSTSS
jgi:peroxin-16